MQEPTIQGRIVIRQFAKNIIESVADAGEKFLDLRRRGTTSQDLLSLCEDLISHRGAASGIALAREVVNRYRSLDRDEKLAFFLEMNQKMKPNLEEIQRAAGELIQAPDEKTLRDLSAAMTSNRQKLFSRMNMAPNGTAAIVALRQDLMDFLREHPELKAIDEDIKRLLRSWFNPGFLTLQKIDWNTEASILEKIIQYEAVHSIDTWDDLKQRLVEDCRCFAYFHPALEDEPLIFVEIALTRGAASSMARTACAAKREAVSMTVTGVSPVWDWPAHSFLAYSSNRSPGGACHCHKPGKGR